MQILPPTANTGRLIRRLALGVGVPAVALALAACQTQSAPRATPGSGDVHTGLPEGVPAYMVKGSPDALVTMIEWSDYECPYCSKYVDEAGKSIDEEYVNTGKVRVAFRDFPLNSIHPSAQKASEAARCAGELGGSEAYWLMHDRLFETQDAWSASEDSSADFKALAAEAKVDAATFASCLDNGEQAAAVEASQAAGMAEGLQATPTMTLGGVMVEGAYPFETFKEKIDILLVGGALPTSTVPPTPEYVEVDAPTAEVAIGDAPVQGADDAPITLIEYSDYECPYCAGFYTASNQVLIDEFVKTGKVRYAFKDFPLLQLHANAQKAAEAAHCARDQSGDEGYWKMHDALFGQQEAWAGQESPTDTWVKLATDAGLDGAALKACIEAGTHAQTVEASFNEALDLGINGTPTLIFNGQIVPGVLEPESLRDAMGKIERGEPLKTWVLKEAAQATETVEAGTQ